MKKLLVKNIGLLATPEGRSAHRGEEQGKIKFLKDAWVLIEDGIIASVGTGAVPAVEGAEVVDAEGHLVTPGLVDAHTHLIFGGWRQNELGLKLHGASYLDIQNAGGGIQSTTNATRQASEQELAAKASKALDEMMGFGTTTVEAKSGYGLATEHELKALELNVGGIPEVGVLHVDHALVVGPALKHVRAAGDETGFKRPCAGVDDRAGSILVAFGGLN